MKITHVNLTVGDSVCVKKGIVNSDSGVNMEGWQGRITEIEEDEKRRTLICVSWDSVTLKNMPRSFLEESEEEGLDWERYYLWVEDVEPAESRDTEKDVARVVDEIMQNIGWYSLGEEGKRIQKVVVGTDDEWKSFKAWKRYMKKNLYFPFEAKISEPQSRGRLKQGEKVTVLNISGLDAVWGVIVAVKQGSERLDFPLCDLKVLGKESLNQQIVSDYAVWYANH
jgi:hypothetical protein